MNLRVIAWLAGAWLGVIAAGAEMPLNRFRVAGPIPEEQLVENEADRFLAQDMESVCGFKVQEYVNPRNPDVDGLFFLEFFDRIPEERAVAYAATEVEMTVPCRYLMKLNTDSFVGVGICILGLVGVGYAIGVHSKMKTVCDKLDTSIDRLANETEVDIPAKVIDQAVQRAVDRESYSAVKRATDEVMDDVKREIESRVGAAVKEHYDVISDGVTDQIAKSVAKIDESRLKKEVVQKAKEQIAEKFDDKLDDILEEFNGNLQNVGKIYKSIAKSFSKEDI